jgi:hypothetical protein
LGSLDQPTLSRGLLFALAFLLDIKFRELNVVGEDRLGMRAVDVALDDQLKRLSNLSADGPRPFDSSIYSCSIGRRFEAVARAIGIVFVFGVQQFSDILLL